MADKTPQEVASELNKLRSQAINIVEGTISGGANPGGTIAFTYRNPIDGQTHTAEGIAWNQCSPSKVSALKLTDGSWIVVGAHEASNVRSSVHTDRRARQKPKSGGKVKTLHSRVEGEERVFYLWGDRATPKRIFAITKDSRVLLAKVDNLGDGDRWMVGLQWESTTQTQPGQFNLNYAIVHTQVFSNSQTWVEDTTIGRRDLANERGFSPVKPTMKYMGYGYWITATNVTASPPIVNTFYQGVVGTLTGSSSGTLVPVPGGAYDATFTITTPVSLTQARTASHRSFALNFSEDFSSGEIITPFLFGKNTGYYEYYADQGQFSPRRHKLVTDPVATDALFTADNNQSLFPFAMRESNLLAGNIDGAGAGHLIGSQYAVMFNSFRDAINGAIRKRWKVTFFKIGNPSVKTELLTLVRCKVEPPATFHSASYHP